MRYGNACAHLAACIRADKDIQRYVTTHKGGPEWDAVVLRAMVNLDAGSTTQDIISNEQPTGYDRHAALLV